MHSGAKQRRNLPTYLMLTPSHLRTFAPQVPTMKSLTSTASRTENSDDQTRAHRAAGGRTLAVVYYARVPPEGLPHRVIRRRGVVGRTCFADADHAGRQGNCDRLPHAVAAERRAAEHRLPGITADIPRATRRSHDDLGADLMVLRGFVARVREAGLAPEGVPWNCSLRVHRHVRARGNAGTPRLGIGDGGVCVRVGDIYPKGSDRRVQQR